MVKALIDKGLLTVDPGVFTEAVVVTMTSVDEPVMAYTAPVGTPVPADLTKQLDPEVWKSPHDALTEVLGDVESWDGDNDEDGGTAVQGATAST
jgi:hypothetical protein